MSDKTKAQPMATRPGWNYETPKALYQLWPPSETILDWAASWTERREEQPADYYLDDDDGDDGWRPLCDFRRAPSPDNAMRCFPSSPEAKRARAALLAACQI